MLKRELAEKYRNAVPLDISESTFGKYHSLLSLAVTSFASANI